MRFFRSSSVISSMCAAIQSHLPSSMARSKALRRRRACRSARLTVSGVVRPSKARPTSPATSPPILTTLRTALSTPLPIFWETSSILRPTSSMPLLFDHFSPAATMRASASTASFFKNGATRRSVSQFISDSLSAISFSRHSPDTKGANRAMSAALSFCPLSISSSACLLMNGAICSKFCRSMFSGFSGFSFSVFTSAS